MTKGKEKPGEVLEAQAWIRRADRPIELRDLLLAAGRQTMYSLAAWLHITPSAVWQALHGVVRSARVYAFLDELSGAPLGTAAAVAERERERRREAVAKRFAQCAMAHRAEEASRTSGGGLRSVPCHTAGKDNQEDKETTR